MCKTKFATVNGVVSSLFSGRRKDPSPPLFAIRGVLFAKGEITVSHRVCRVLDLPMRSAVRRTQKNRTWLQVRVYVTNTGGPIASSTRDVFCRNF